MIKADNLRNAYNIFIDNETFDGDAADALKDYSMKWKYNY